MEERLTVRWDIAIAFDHSHTFVTLLSRGIAFKIVISAHKIHFMPVCMHVDFP